MDDEMDYVMHHRQETSLSPPQPPHAQHLQHHQQHHQQQHRQCPYWSEHQLSPFAPHYGTALPPHNHASIHSHHHPQPSQNPGLAAPNSRNQASHHYDPVHSSIPALNNAWYPAAPPYHWSITLPHPRTSLPDTFYPYPANSSSPGVGGGVGSAGASNNNNSSGGNGSGSGSSNSSGNGSGGGGSSSRGVGGPEPTSATPGPVQPSVVQNHHTPRHEPFTPFPIAWTHQSTTVHRFSAVPPPMSAPPQPHQSGQTGHQVTPFTPTGSEPSGIRLPALNPPVLPRPTQTSQHQHQQQQQQQQQQTQQDGSAGHGGPSTMPSSEIQSPPNPVVLHGRANTSGFPEMPRSRALFDGSPHHHPEPDAAGNTAEQSGVNGSTPPLISISAERRRLVNMQRRHTAARPSDSSDYDSEDEAADAEDQRALQLFEQLASTGAGIALRGGEEMNEARIRAHQLLRGQMSTKRIASKSALASLQSVEISSLPDSEKTCIICYNEFGVENPEGINEAPLRLPRCKHVFGDHCIKKWFEESDSCPYCRDKVPSEPQFKAGGQALREFFSRHSQARTTLRALQMEQSSGSPFAMLRDSDVSRYVRSPTTGMMVDVTPPRTWQTGERRSPPSEAVENRRRTRARHGSFRGSSGVTSGATATGRPVSYAGASPSATQHQQSPGRERFPAGSYRPQSHFQPHESTWQSSYNRIGGLPTPFMAEPLGLNPPSTSSQASFQSYMPPPVFAAPAQGLQEQMTSNPGGSGAPSAEPPQPFPGPASMASFPFTNAPDGFGFTPSGNQNNQANNNSSNNNNNRADGYAYANNAQPANQGGW